MKKPKNKDFIFLVIRENSKTGEHTNIASFRLLEDAENYAGECCQTFLDKNITEYVFGVETVIWYE